MHTYTHTLHAVISYLMSLHILLLNYMCRSAHMHLSARYKFLYSFVGVYLHAYTKRYICNHVFANEFKHYTLERTMFSNQTYRHTLSSLQIVLGQ